jgi:Family of unknown function (DUF6167)
VRRMFWLALGATAGVLAVRRLSKAVAAVTPRGLADSAGDLGATMRAFLDEVQAGMAERELELRDALGLDGVGDSASDGAPAGPIDEARRDHLIQHPATHQFGER